MNLTGDWLRPGIRIGDHELLSKIDEGSYGEVWLARNDLETYRALKVVPRSRFDSARPLDREFEGIKRFEPISREYEGLVDILQVGRNQGEEFFYYVMELADDQVAGRAINPEKYIPQTLANLVKLKKRLPIQECVQIGTQLCRTLRFLHDRGLIHRDVKPSNIIYIEGKPKLADIGLVAEIVDAKTIVGTTGFIPPEGPNSVQADIFALGKLLYEISTGRDRNEFPTLPDQTELTEEFLELNEVLLKACHTDARQRYQSAAAMEADLNLVAAGRSVKRLHHLELRIRKIKQIAPIAAIILLILAGIWSQFYQTNQRKREEEQRIIGNQIGLGSALLRQGDLLGALPFFVEAMRSDELRKSDLSTHRLRLGVILAIAPTIEGLWHLERSPRSICDLTYHKAIVSIRSSHSSLIDLESRQILVKRLGTNGEPESARFVPGGDMVLTANWDGTARIIDGKTGLVVQKFEHQQPLLFAAPSTDGRMVITACHDGKAYVWNREEGTLKKILGSHEKAVFCAKFSPSGKLAVTTSMDHTAQVWDVDTGRPVGTRLKHKSWIYSADFSSDDVVATAGYDRVVRFWEVQTGREVGPALQHDDGVFSVQFSPDRNLILTACLDGTAKLWETSTHQLRSLNHTLKHRSRLAYACFSPNGNHVLTAASDGVITYWNIFNTNLAPELIGSHSREPPATVTSPDGQWQILTNKGRLDVQSKRTGQIIRTDSMGGANLIQFSRDGRKLLCIGGTNVYLTDLLNGSTSNLKYPRPVTWAEFSPDSRKMVVASSDKTFDEHAAQIWNVEDGQRIGSPLRHRDGVSRAHFSSDSRWVVTAGEDFSAMVWNANSGQLVGRKMQHRHQVRDAHFARAHPWIVTASEDATAVIWDVVSGNQLTPPLVHSQPLVTATFDDEDRVIVTVDKEGNRWRWRLPFEGRSGHELGSLAASLAGLEPKEPR